MTKEELLKQIEELNCEIYPLYNKGFERGVRESKALIEQYLKEIDNKKTIIPCGYYNNGVDISNPIRLIRPEKDKDVLEGDGRSYVNAGEIYINEKCSNMKTSEIEVIVSALSSSKEIISQDIHLLTITGDKPDKLNYLENSIMPNINEAYEIIKREYYNTYKNK